jgi:hypothetical protein
MINFDRAKFDELNTQQKITFVNNLVMQNTQLTPEEIEYLVPQNREKYFYNRVRTSNWLDDYEFNELSDKDKEVYIWKKRFLDNSELQRLSPDLQKQYISKTITSGVQISPEEFSLFKNDEIKKYYVNEKIKYSITSSFTPEELSFLDSKEQIKYLNTLIRMGLAPNTDEFKTFKPETMRYYQSHKTLNEMRVIIRSEIKKIL